MDMIKEFDAIVRDIRAGVDRSVVTYDHLLLEHGTHLLKINNPERAKIYVEFEASQEE